MERTRFQNKGSAQGPCIAWRIENATGDEADVYLYDVIGDPWAGTTANDFVRELRDLGDVKRLNLHINSPGGYVSDALAMYNALLQHPAEVTALIESEAASAASFVAMSADTIAIAKNAKIFIHDARGLGMGNAADMRALADILDEESENIASIYAERTGKPASAWRDAMRANDGIGTTYRGQDAVDAGLADEILARPEKSAKNVEPVRVAAQAEPAEPIEIPIDLIPRAANGYKRPLPDDFTRLVAANMPALKEG